MFQFLVIVSVLLSLKGSWTFLEQESHITSVVFRSDANPTLQCLAVTLKVQIAVVGSGDSMLQPSIGVFSNNDSERKEIKTSISVYESKT